MSDSDDGLENWQNRLYELHGHRCARLTKSLIYLSTQPRELPTDEDLTHPEEFIAPLLAQVPESHIMQILETSANRWP